MKQWYGLYVLLCSYGGSVCRVPGRCLNCSGWDVGQPLAFLNYFTWCEHQTVWVISLPMLYARTFLVSTSMTYNWWISFIRPLMDLFLHHRYLSTIFDILLQKAFCITCCSSNKMKSFGPNISSFDMNEYEQKDTNILGYVESVLSLIIVLLNWGMHI